MQKLPVGDFEWVEETSQFNEGFLKRYNEDSDEKNTMNAIIKKDTMKIVMKKTMNAIIKKDTMKKVMKDVDVQYPEKLCERHNDLLFLPERMKIEKVEKLIANLHDKKEYIIKTWLKKFD